MRLSRLNLNSDRERPNGPSCRVHGRTILGWVVVRRWRSPSTVFCRILPGASSYARPCGDAGERSRLRAKLSMRCRLSAGAPRGHTKRSIEIAAPLDPMGRPLPVCTSGIQPLTTGHRRPRELCGDPRPGAEPRRPDGEALAHYRRTRGRPRVTACGPHRRRRRERRRRPRLRHAPTPASNRREARAGSRLGARPGGHAGQPEASRRNDRGGRAGATTDHDRPRRTCTPVVLSRWR